MKYEVMIVFTLSYIFRYVKYNQFFKTEVDWLRLKKVQFSSATNGKEYVLVDQYQSGLS